MTDEDKIEKILNHEAAAGGTSLATVVVSYGTQRLLVWMMDGSHHVRRDNVLGWRKDTRASSSTKSSRCLTGMTCSFLRLLLVSQDPPFLDLTRHAPFVAEWLAG